MNTTAPTEYVLNLFNSNMNSGKWINKKEFLKNKQYRSFHLHCGYKNVFDN